MPSHCSPGVSWFPSDLRPFSNTETHQESSTRNYRTKGTQLHLKIKQQCQQQKSATVKIETVLCHGLAEKWKLWKEQGKGESPFLCWWRGKDESSFLVLMLAVWGFIFFPVCCFPALWRWMKISWQELKSKSVLGSYSGSCFKNQSHRKVNKSANWGISNVLS